MRVIPTICFLLLPILCLAQGPSPVPLLLKGIDADGQTAAPGAVFIAKPATSPVSWSAEAHLVPPAGTEWHHGDAIEGSLVLPADLPPARLLAFLKDRDGHWFQTLLPEHFGPGTNRWTVPFSARARNRWQPVGHHLAWNHRVRLDPRFVGLRLFFERPLEAPGESCVLRDARLVPSPADETPPSLSPIRLSTEAPACFSLLEGTFRLPDRYDNPFDPGEIDVMADVTLPDDKVVSIPAFYTQDFYAEENANGVRLVPDGAPGWRVRYAPVLPGPHSLRIRATDRRGSVTSPPVAFTAQASEGPAYITVSRRNRRRFADGTNDFFPIGHNIRSPFDTRYDTQYPWRLRIPENYTVYRRYFEQMAKAGENMAEIWMCQWSLGLEWSTVSPGYHGLGDYHLGNAWELDQVLGFARESDIRLNLVLNNHGRAGLGFDAEWGDSPYNTNRGGFLPADDPLRFFSDPRAIDLQKRINRYIVARWGWSPTIFAFELWSELDLCGGGKTKGEPHDNAEVIAWHRMMGAYLKSIDPNKHLVSTHISGNYNHVRPTLMKIPELDHCCVDAYHGSTDPLHIANLVRGTGHFFKPFEKPVLITEFGGSSMGAGVSHISIELHAALWSSVCSTLAGTPFLWWWGLIDEQNLYPEFTAVKTFLEGTDHQDPALRPYALVLVNSDPENTRPQTPPGRLSRMALASGTNLFAWIYDPHRLAARYYGTTPTNAIPIEATAIWQPVSNGVYRVIQCDTRTGKAVRTQDHRTSDGVLRFPLAPFDSDCAIKVGPR